MKRPIYLNAIAWIAENDNSGSGDDIGDIEGYATTLLVADLWGLDEHLVAVAVFNERMRRMAKSRGPEA